jgi:hypothetical protein
MSLLEPLESLVQSTCPLYSKANRFKQWRVVDMDLCAKPQPATVLGF